MPFVPINKSCIEGTLPLDNYSGFKPGDQVVFLKHDLRTESDLYGEVYDVRFVNSPRSALYYVYVKTQIGFTCVYPERLKKVNL